MNLLYAEIHHRTPAQIVHFSSRPEDLKKNGTLKLVSIVFKISPKYDEMHQNLVPVDRASYFATNLQHLSDFLRILHTVTGNNSQLSPMAIFKILQVTSKSYLLLVSIYHDKGQMTPMT